MKRYIITYLPGNNNSSYYTCQEDMLDILLPNESIVTKIYPILELWRVFITHTQAVIEQVSAALSELWLVETPQISYISIWVAVIWLVATAIREGPKSSADDMANFEFSDVLVACLGRYLIINT